MITIILTLHIIIAVALVGVILLQRSEGGGLGIGGSGQGGGGFMTARGTANLLTRATAGLAVAFFITSITLAILSGNTGTGSSIVDEVLDDASGQTGIPALPSVPTNQ